MGGAARQKAAPTPTLPDNGGGSKAAQSRPRPEPTGRAGGWLRLVTEKLPLLALAAACSVVTLRAQSEHPGDVGGLGTFGPLVRLENAAVSCATYLVQTFWPADLAVYYPHPIYVAGSGGRLPAWQVAGSALLLLALTAGAVALRRRAPYVLAGWLWFLGTLVPVIGLVQVGAQAHADRYTYFPQLGLLLVLCWGLADLAPAWPRLLVSAAAVAAAALAAVTWQQLAYWHDSVALWEHALRVTPPSVTAVMDLANAYEDRGEWEKAARCYEQALRLPFGEGAAQFRLGALFLKQNRFGEAAPHLARACELDRTDADAWLARGQAESGLGHSGPAEACFREVLNQRPRSAEALAGLGILRLPSGDPEQGIRLLRQAVDADSRCLLARMALGRALLDRGDLAGAEPHLRAAAQLNPKSALAWYNLGCLRGKQHDLEGAADCLLRALELDRSPAFFWTELNDVRKGLAAQGRTEALKQIDGRLRPLTPAGRSDGLAPRP